MLALPMSQAKSLVTLGVCAGRRERVLTANGKVGRGKEVLWSGVQADQLDSIECDSGGWDKVEGTSEACELRLGRLSL